MTKQEFLDLVSLSNVMLPEFEKLKFKTIDNVAVFVEQVNIGEAVTNLIYGVVLMLFHMMLVLLCLMMLMVLYFMMQVIMHHLRLLMKHHLLLATQQRGRFNHAVR